MPLRDEVPLRDEALTSQLDGRLRNSRHPLNEEIELEPDRHVQRDSRLLEAHRTKERKNEYIKYQTRGYMQWNNKGAGNGNIKNVLNSQWEDNWHMERTVDWAKDKLQSRSSQKKEILTFDPFKILSPLPVSFCPTHLLMGVVYF